MHHIKIFMLIGFIVSLTACHHMTNEDLAEEREGGIWGEITDENPSS